MNSFHGILCLLLASFLSGDLVHADEQNAINAEIRVLSWNVSDDSFVSDPQGFHAMLLRANADILLLDEVSPTTTEQQLRRTLVEPPDGEQADWYIDVGKSGGRQRAVVVSRWPLEALPEFSSIVPYPAADRTRILQQMSAAERNDPGLSMDGGIPVNGAVILAGGRRLLTIVADLQCCGDSPRSWQEYRRRVESKVIRDLVRKILSRTSVDAIILAGDFNMVNGSIPLVSLVGPYQPPHAGLIPAEIYHLDGSTTWTWDGRGTPFPSSVLDYQLYSPQSLKLLSGTVLDTEDLSMAELEEFGLKENTSKRLSRHRPLVARYEWH